MADLPPQQSSSVSDASSNNPPSHPSYCGASVSDTIDETKFRKITVKTAKCQICLNKCAGVQCNKCRSVWCEKCRDRNKQTMGHPLAHYNCESSPIKYDGAPNGEGWWVTTPPSYAANRASSSTAVVVPNTGNDSGSVAAATTGATQALAATNQNQNQQVKKPVRHIKSELEKLQEGNIHGVPEIWGAEGLQRHQRARQTPGRFDPTYLNIDVGQSGTRAATPVSKPAATASMSPQPFPASRPSRAKAAATMFTPFPSAARKEKRRRSVSSEPTAAKAKGDQKPAAKKPKATAETSFEERPKLIAKKPKPTVTASSRRIPESTAEKQKVATKASHSTLPEISAQKPTIQPEAPANKKQYGPDGRRLGLPADAPSQGPKVLPKLTPEDISKVMTALHTGLVQMPQGFVPPPGYGYEDLPSYVPPPNPYASAYGGGSGGQGPSGIRPFVPPAMPYGRGQGASGGLGVPPRAQEKEGDEEDSDETEVELPQRPCKK